MSETRIPWEEWPEAPEGTRLILVAVEVGDQWGTRTEDGDRITFDWGEPNEYGWYTPTFTRHHDDNLRAAVLARFLASPAVADALAEAMETEWRDNHQLRVWPSRDWDVAAADILRALATSEAVDRLGEVLG